VKVDLPLSFGLKLIFFCPVWVSTISVAYNGDSRWWDGVIVRRFSPWDDSTLGVKKPDIIFPIVIELVSMEIF
jgi:hypothetical protein